MTQFKADVERIALDSEQRAGRESRWVVARYGVQRPQFLSTTRIWDTIGNAAWFIDRATSHAAVCPHGTTGIAIEMHALPRTI
jgi:hypothetical protein